MSNNEIRNMAFQNVIEIEKRAFEAVEENNYPDARRLLEPLADSGSEYALMTLGWIHENGKGVSVNLTSAQSFYQRAAEIGCLEAYNCLGLVLRKEGEFVRAREVYTEGAELGNLGSMAWLGAMMVWAEGGPKNIKDGELWLSAAAEAGHFYAKALLLTLERENSRSAFKHIIFYVRRVILSLRAGKEYYTDPYTEKIF